METITFQNTETDLMTLGKVCQDLEARGLPPKDAAAYVLADMAQQAMRQGINPKEVCDALHHVINNGLDPQPEEKPKPEETKRIKYVMTQEQVDRLHQQMNTLRDLLLYWDMVLCNEIQRYAFLVIDRMKEKGIYRHELKQYANKLSDEARRVQMRIKDNDKAVVTKWCLRIDKRGKYAHEFYEDGASAAAKFSVAFQKQFKHHWDLVMMDCKEAAKTANTEHEDIVVLLLALEALTHTGIELYDACVKRMKQLMTGKGTFNIRKSMHHESMCNAVNNLLRKLVKGDLKLTAQQRDYARDHLASMQLDMITKGMDSFFRTSFDGLSADFVIYAMAWMRIEMEEDRLSAGAIRMVWDRLGTRHRVEKFFKELGGLPLPEGDADVFDVANGLLVYELQNKVKEISRFKAMCLYDKRHISDESQAKQEARILRQQARKNNGMLPNEVIAVMAMHYKTKKALVEHLGTLGFELKPTLQRVKKMKTKELKQLA